jgi:hypothetical protein
LPRDALFWIEWLGEDLDRHPRETFLVWLNQVHKEQLGSLELGGSSGKVMGLSISAQVLAEIAAAVLSSDQEPAEPNGTIQIVSDVLAKVSKSSLAEMRLRFRQHSGNSLLRAWSQETVGLPRHFQSLSFIGASS